MRKGRSSRRSRVSRPLIGVKLESLSTEVGPASTPRVVVGIPESDPPPSEQETPIAPEVAETKGSPSEPPQRESFANTRFASSAELLKKKSPSTPAAKNEAGDEHDDKTQTFASFASTIAFGSSGHKEEKKEEKLASTIAFGSEALTREAKEAIALAGIDSMPLSSDAPPPSSSLAAKIEPVKIADAPKVEPIKADEPKVEPAKVEAKIFEDTVPMKLDKTAPMMGAPKRPIDTRKETSPKDSSRPPPKNSTSVPPVAMDEKDEKFFSEGDLSRHLAGEGIEATEALTIPDKVKRKSEPAVVLRRARLARYVKFAVAGAGILCAAAIARTAMTTSKHAPAAPVALAAKPADAPAPKAAEPAAAPAPAETATPAPADSAAAPATDPAAPAAAPAGSTDEKGAAAEAKPSDEAKPATEEVTGDPKEEKAKMRTALERRKLADAVAAGEKSVALDPTDGEAWLLLGASYQELGKMGEARRCYAACLKEGKTGPRHECMKMLR